MIRTGLKILVISLFICFSNEVTVAQQFENYADSINLDLNYESSDLWGCGTSFYDFNNDGLDDLVLLKENDSIHFYISQNGELEKTSSFIYADGEVKSVLWVDFDNDGDLDLFMTLNKGPYRLFENDGDFNFTDISAQAGLYFSNSRTQGASFADINNNGFLDLYVCKYEFGFTEQDTDKLNQLYRNNGDGTFTNITLTAGVGDSIRASFQGIWFDYDLDGYVDLYVINDRVLFDNKLYRNNGDETFTDVTAQTGLEMPAQDPMTTTVGDFDNDGDLDIYITNTGNSRTGHLFVNNGDGTFTNQAEQLNVDNDKWSWGALWVDYDNDSWKDLYVATGMPNNFSTQFHNYFYKNQQGVDFVHDNSPFIGDIATRSTGVARGDFNGDGYYDVAVQNLLPQQPYIWKNTGGTNNYIKITPNGTVSNKFAIGTWIKVYAGGEQFTEYTFCGENYLSQNSQHQIFGLKSLPSVDSVEVTYPSGHTDKYYNLPANEHYYFYEGETLSASVNVSDTLICENIDLYAYTDKNSNIEWNDGSNLDSLLVIESGSYYYTWTSPNGIKVDSDTVNINIVNSPFLSADIQNVSCYEGKDGKVDIMLFHDTLGVYPEITWDNGFVGFSQDSLASGEYEIYYEDSAKCKDTLSFLIQTPMPLNSSFITQDEVQGHDGSIEVFSHGGTPPYVYFLNGNNAQPPYQNLTQGEYIVEMHDFKECSKIDTVIINSTLSTGNKSLDNFKVFPNPLPRGQNLTIECEFCENKNITINDISGKEVYYGKIPSNNTISINLSKGTYFIHIENSDKTSKKYKLVVI